MAQQHTNRLIHESSPYLLQHAHNPVDWHPWGEEALEKARREDKPLLISIGYAACHWCHVMEHESFEDPELARIMNQNFVCIKVDREERPDIDQVYMTAVQLITGSGGWPLNCFALPDGRPFYGGTYFPPQQWRVVLESLARSYRDDREKVIRAAQQLSQGVADSETLLEKAADVAFTQEDLDHLFVRWKSRFDTEHGGNVGAPKFPMPASLQFLLRYHFQTQDSAALAQVELTLEKMALGGLYDGIGGGFARYSVDGQWHVPHFEKMLYDNAQLVSLYAKAFAHQPKPLYRQVVFETLAFVERELQSPQGAFYSSLDADSQGHEGAFYVWTRAEVDSLLGHDSPIFCHYYDITPEGNWEDGLSIPRVRQTLDQVAQAHQSTPQQVQDVLDRGKRVLLQARGQRPRPGLDDKILTAWNALMVKAYVDAYQTFSEDAFLEQALRGAEFIGQHMLQPDGSLLRNHKDGRSTINAFLDDYSFTIEAFIALYEATFDERWLVQAKRLAEHATEHFLDPKSGMFFYTSDRDPVVVARKMELTDNVIPASNSSMAHALHRLGQHFEDGELRRLSRQMLLNVKQYALSNGNFYANWGLLLQSQVFPGFEVAIAGPEAQEARMELQSHYLPNVLWAGASSPSELPLMRDRHTETGARIFVCQGQSCLLPTDQTAEALRMLGR